MDISYLSSHYEGSDWTWQIADSAVSSTNAVGLDGFRPVFIDDDGSCELNVTSDFITDYATVRSIRSTWTTEPLTFTIDNFEFNLNNIGLGSFWSWHFTDERKNEPEKELEFPEENQELDDFLAEFQKK